MLESYWAIKVNDVQLHYSTDTLKTLCKPKEARKKKVTYCMVPLI